MRLDQPRLIPLPGQAGAGAICPGGRAMRVCDETPFDEFHQNLEMRLLFWHRIDGESPLGEGLTGRGEAETAPPAHVSTCH
ncbi:MAG TPA: hypothetical protein PLW36_01815 [Methanoculleus sp.]|nr:hypothetical protein [Methanoculleus sp.]